jgi:hypothetical protein
MKIKLYFKVDIGSNSSNDMNPKGRSIAWGCVNEFDLRTGS